MVLQISDSGDILEDGTEGDIAVHASAPRSFPEITATYHVKNCISLGTLPVDCCHKELCKKNRTLLGRIPLLHHV